MGVGVPLRSAEVPAKNWIGASRRNTVTLPRKPDACRTLAAQADSAASVAKLFSQVVLEGRARIVDDGCGRLSASGERDGDRSRLAACPRLARL
jgi:hypothetical protein